MFFNYFIFVIKIIVTTKIIFTFDITRTCCAIFEWYLKNKIEEYTMQQVEKFNRQKIRRKILLNFLTTYVCELNEIQDSVTRKQRNIRKECHPSLSPIHWFHTIHPWLDESVNGNKLTSKIRYFKLTLITNFLLLLQQDIYIKFYTFF